jgi:hypothetical protein
MRTKEEEEEVCDQVIRKTRQAGAQKKYVRLSSTTPY